MTDTSYRIPVESVRKWHALAERRRRYYVELFRSERWRRYYTEEAFLAHMRDVIETADHWHRILEQWPNGNAPAVSAAA